MDRVTLFLSLSAHNSQGHSLSACHGLTAVPTPLRVHAPVPTGGCGQHSRSVRQTRRGLCPHTSHRVTVRRARWHRAGPARAVRVPPPAWPWSAQRAPPASSAHGGCGFEKQARFRRTLLKRLTSRKTWVMTLVFPQLPHVWFRWAGLPRGDRPQ